VSFAHDKELLFFEVPFVACRRAAWEARIPIVCILLLSNQPHRLLSGPEQRSHREQIREPSCTPLVAVNRVRHRSRFQPVVARLWDFGRKHLNQRIDSRIHDPARQ
jgi:hypothetical protein